MPAQKNVIIFGATGGTGQILVNEAIAQGHRVTAFVRTPERYQQTNENLRIVKGDVLNIASVEQAMQGQDAVFCTLGMPNIMDRSLLRTKGTKNIIHAMEKYGVKRLICQSGLGAGKSYASLPVHYKYFIAPIFMRALYVDHNGQEKLIKQSPLDWTIVRPASLTNGKFTGQYWHGLAGTDQGLNIKISRADVASFMLKQLEDQTYLRKSPVISYEKCKKGERSLQTDKSV